MNDMDAKEFWSWFTKNQNKYFFLNQVESNVKEKLLNDFQIQIHKFCNSLFFEIGGHPDKTQDLIITAEGNTQYFNKVEELVNAAPKLKDWNIIAFKPPMEFGYKLTYANISADSNNLWFLPLENKELPNSLAFRIGFPDFESNKEKDFKFIAYLILDTILGEKSTALDIDYMDVDILPDDPDNNGFIHLRELKNYIDWHKKKTNAS
jgi:hypothetical protein